MGQPSPHALLAQAQANRLLAQAQLDRGLTQVAPEVDASALEEIARAGRVLAEVMLAGMARAPGCGEPICRDELQAWFHDVHGVAAVGSALDLIGGGAAVGKVGPFLGGCHGSECGKVHRGAGVGAAAGVDASTQCVPGELVEGCSGRGKWQCGTKRMPSVLELLCQKSLKSSA